MEEQRREAKLGPGQYVAEHLEAETRFGDAFDFGGLTHELFLGG